MARFVSSLVPKRVAAATREGGSCRKNDNAGLSTALRNEPFAKISRKPSASTLAR